MLTITDAAGGYLTKVLDEAQVSDETAVRLVAAPEGLTAALDTEKPGDASFDHDGRKVLLLDQLASQVLDERTLDVQNTPDGDKLGLT